MFHPASVSLCYLGVNICGNKLLSEKTMTLIDFLSNFPSYIGQMEKVFVIHPEKSTILQSCYRIAYAWFRYLHVLGYIHGAHHPFLFLEYQHSLQVVLAGRMKFHGVPPLQFPGLCHFFFFPHFPIKRYLLQHLPMCTAT